MTRRMPNPGEPVVGPHGLITRAWNDFLRQLESVETTAGLSDQLRQLESQVQQLQQEIDGISGGGFLPTSTNVFGRNSVASFGLLNGGVVFLELTNDVAEPLAFHYYGTDADGVRGYHDHALATLSDVDVTTTPPTVGDSLRFDGAKWSPGLDPGQAVFNYMTADGDIYVTEDGADLYIGV